MPKSISITIPDADLIPKRAKHITLQRFLCLLFKQNQEFVKQGKQPWSDEMLREICRRRYPQSKVVGNFFRNGRHTVNEFRGRFNRGELESVIDYRNYSFISFRYDEYGMPVEPRRGRVELTKQDQEVMIAESVSERIKRGIYENDVDTEAIKANSI